VKDDIHKVPMPDWMKEQSRELSAQMIRPVIRHGKHTFENAAMDAYRDINCMCWSCFRFGACSLYDKAFRTLIEPHGLTFMVTRCPYYLEGVKDAQKRRMEARGASTEGCLTCTGDG